MTSGGHGAPTPISATVNVELHGATTNARAEFAAAVQSFAESLANECERQEISNRPPGIAHPEITANSVVRAKQVLSRFGERSKGKSLDVVGLMGVPVFSGATGVMGSFLHSTVQIVAFAVLALLAILCTGYLAYRRLL